MDKRALRKECFARLRGLSASQKRVQSAVICKFLNELASFQSAKVLLSFYPLQNEPDLSPLMWPESDSGKVWGLSAVEENDKLTFRQVDEPDLQLREGAFGIREPIEESCPEIDLQKVDIVLVPGVGFDPETGARLGRGKGHYDRFLSSLLKQRDGALPPKIVGVAFSQQLRKLNPEHHDVPMDCLLTDDGFAYRLPDTLPTPGKSGIK